MFLFAAQVLLNRIGVVFKDSKAISIFDDDHSENEDRWIK
jgi:hypothetical protein